MTGTTRSSAGLDPRRRRLLFRAWHRGTREMDLLMGRFADALLPEMSEEEVDAFELLIEIEDPDLLGWVNAGVAPAPFDTPMFQRFCRFHLSGEGLPEI
ncbi:succinate dehydrogenase assembly factor 2 [Ancylobacter sonchi]|uniref:FAD assembly factor SdhE n=1 Tax=Ancylobacter TaxID=99 RepID=UPI001BD55AEA|nr:MULTISPECIES: succinate dehydrogenase assembly factor 2 [Ancylobacter]MBS7532610.1 succinate dehydrogenase assembly factor 2 [Ancylobacter sonchi]MCB4771847.1 succinate dehydrogenase assembly factor 2 [Ancylobacter sp. Lp-2]